MPHYLGMYDVSCPTLRSRIFHTLSAYGIHRQKSVFECNLKTEAKKELLEQLYLLSLSQPHNILMIQIYPQHAESILFGEAKHMPTSHCLYIG